MAISDNRLVVYLVYCALMAMTFPLVARNLAHPGFFSALVLAYVLGALVPSCIVFGRQLDLVEPLYWFSAKYYLVFPGALYFLITGFAYSEHLLNPGMARLQQLTERALLLFIVGYASFLVGYLVLMRDHGARKVRLPTRREMAGWIARSLIWTCVFIGLLNFAYLLLSYPGGPVRYLLDFGMRAHRYELIEGTVTTFGYQFLYAGIYLWFMVLARDGRLRKSSGEFWLFLAIAALSVIVSISQGRLSQSISYLLMLGFFGYVLSRRPASNARFMLLGVFGLTLAIVLYFLRRLSVALHGESTGITLDHLAQFAEVFLPALGYFLIDKGNVPDLAIVVNILGQDGIAGEMWYGRSLVIWVTKISPLLGDLPSIATTSAATWFGEDGGLPPTIIGEMFVNFGYIGVPVGLFLVGFLCSWFYGFIRTRAHFMWYLVYLAVLFKFIFLWPKGETANLVAAIWQFLPALTIFGVIRLLSSAHPAPLAPPRAELGYQDVHGSR